MIPFVVSNEAEVSPDDLLVPSLSINCQCSRYLGSKWRKRS